MTKSKKQNKKFRKIDLSNLNSSAPTGETNKEETATHQKNDEVRKENSPGYDGGTPYSEDPFLTTVEVASSEPVENLIKDVSNCYVHENVSLTTEANYSQNECTSPNSEKDVTCQGKHKKNLNRNRNNSQTSQDESKSAVEKYSKDTLGNRKTLPDDMKPALSNGVDEWTQEMTDQIKPDSSQLQSSVKREMNPNAREFKPKIADPAYVRKEEIGTGSEIVHSEQDKRDGNHNYSQQKWGSEKSEFPSKQYTNRNRQRNDSRRDNDKSRRSYQNSRSNRRSPDGHYSNIREGNEGSRNHRSRERNDYREKRKDSYGRKSSFVNDEYKNRGQVYSNRQPDDHNWNVKQDDQQSYCRGNENSRDATTYDKPEIPNRNEGYKPYQHTRNYNHRREENLTNQERMENSSGRRNSSSAKVEMKTIEPGSFEPLPSDPNWDVELQQKPSDENWDNKVQQQPIDENWDDEIFSGGHEKNQDATTYGIKPLEDRDQFEGISDSWDRNEGHKVNQGIRNQESGNKDRKSSLERKRQQNNEVVPDLRLVKNEKLGATKKYSLKKQNLADPRMDRENKSKQLKSDGIRENDDDTQREPSTSSEKTDGEDNKGDTDLDSRDDQESIFLYDAWNNQDVKCNRKSLPESKPRKTHDRMSAGGESSDDRIEKFHKDYYDRSYEKIDAEYKEFNIEFKWRADHKYIRVTEKEQDLFGMPKEYSLGHCVAEDMRMGSGIAVSFKRDFKNLDDLLSQRQKQGGLAVLQHEGRYVYYLVTKKVSTGKPTYETFWSSLKKMREHVVENEVKKLAIPRIGCGLDRLEWDKVKYMIEFLFKKVEVEIVVCNFQQNYGQTKQKLQTKSDLPKSKQKMKTPPSSSKSGKTKGKKKK